MTKDSLQRTLVATAVLVLTSIVSPGTTAAAPGGAPLFDASKA